MPVTHFKSSTCFITRLSEVDWPLNFIHFCVNQKGEALQIVKDFASDISFLQLMVNTYDLLLNSVS